MSKWKGIILAGGTGTRLYPVTRGVSKQLLPIYDKPMIYYPLSVLMLAGIKDILIITRPEDKQSFQALLNDGSDFGINLQYSEQPSPGGIPQAFQIGKSFIGNDNICLVLGDNIFYGQGFKSFLEKAMSRMSGATIFGYQVTAPKNFGVVEFNNKKEVISIEEKPENPKSNYAITGLYFFDNRVTELVADITPSTRNELEITSLLNIYLNSKNLSIEIFGRGFAWLDTGTHDNLMNANVFIQVIEKRQGLKVACLEEMAYRNGWISKEKLIHASNLLKNTDYGKYLEMIANKHI